MSSDDRGGERRTALLDAATQVFARYGYKKTSMDDVARVAGLSRQGLYLHFESKEQLFRAAVAHVIETTRAASRAALADQARTPGERLLGALEAMDAALVGEGGAEHMTELLEASALLVGNVVEEAERVFTDDLAKALAREGVVEKWADVGLSARELAGIVVSASHGIKHAVTSRADYLKRMRPVLRLVMRARSL